MVTLLTTVLATYLEGVREGKGRRIAEVKCGNVLMSVDLGSESRTTANNSDIYFSSERLC